MGAAFLVSSNDGANLIADVEGEAERFFAFAEACVSDVAVVGTDDVLFVHQRGKPNGNVGGYVADFGNSRVGLNQHGDGIVVIFVRGFTTEHCGEAVVAMGNCEGADVPQFTLAVLECDACRFYGDFSESVVHVYSP